MVAPGPGVGFNGFFCPGSGVISEIPFPGECIPGIVDESNPAGDCKAVGTFKS